MFIHNIYNTFKISVQFIIKNAFILVDCYYLFYTWQLVYINVLAEYTKNVNIMQI